MRLIDADELMKECAIFVAPANNSDFAEVPTWNDAISLIGSAPTIDAVSVVRCKDCRYSDDYYNDGSCCCKHPEHEMRYIGTNWNWYCADGERREL